ncbi:ERAD-associated E3 ubiquitin-protein ligase component HRD3A [Vitis vinifera]|uniref:ERAD-associated E3 ubiquitin-protein ligase component HRD3A n=1 Tax=Vitis vinifera TaxID=29760 RepID=A0A438EY97_VITVI|nr:ERAD-associated E3 ubiquitin-protein ligase component HRD3A [Vitis vinifera]
MLMRRLGRFFGCVESCKACENELLTITGDEELDPSAVSRSHVTKSWILYGAYISSFYLGRWDGLRWRDSDERQISVRLFLQATALYKLVAERGPWSSLSRWALESYLKGDVGKAFLLYSRMAELGYEVAQSNAAWILDKYRERSMCIGESGFCTDAERLQRAHSLWWQASEQGNEHAALLIGDAYYYGRVCVCVYKWVNPVGALGPGLLILGTERDYDRAAKAYMHAKSQSNAQAMFNLGYMHEHGQGLPFDLHLAKRYYDQALEIDSAAKLPVTLALTSLWIRKNYASSFLVDLVDSLPEVYPKVEAWMENVIMEEGNATILTLFVCLLTVLYLRERQRRHVAAAPEAALPLLPNEHGVLAAPH